MPAGKNPHEKWCEYLRLNREPDVLLYPRMPKCGSSTMQELLSQLAEMNGFVHDPLTSNYWGNQAVPEARSKLLYHINHKYLRSGHFLVVDGHEKDAILKRPELKQKTIENIQLIRECKSRAKSDFLYTLYDSVAATKAKEEHRFSAYVHEMTGTNHTVEWCFDNYDCIKKFAHRFNADLSGYICADHCIAAQHGDVKVGLRNALENPRTFAVMGTTEQFTEYLEMLECAYPKFHGMLRLYNTSSTHTNAGTHHITHDALEKVLDEVCDPQINHYAEFYNGAVSYIHERYLFMKANQARCCRRGK